MKKKKRKYRGTAQEYVGKHKGFLITAIASIIGLILLAVILVQAYKLIVQPVEKESSQEETTVPETEETVTVSDQSEDETESVAVVAAEVGAMDDAEDPQASENSDEETGVGATVDVSNLLSNGNEFETTGITYGIDVAKYQGGTIDWKQVAASGVEFAMIRVGYRTEKTGIICEDPCAKYNMQEAQAAGIKLGAYFYSTAINEDEAKEEAAWVAGYIAQYKITYPVAYNCEGFLSAESRQYTLSKDERTNNAVAFLNTIYEAGYTPMFYAAKNELTENALWNTDVLEKSFKIWVSQYPDAPYPQTAKSSYTGTHAMWQYTSQGTVSGISGSVDVNIAYFGYTQETEAKNTTVPEVVAANPEVGITFTEVNENVTAKIETNLRTVPSSASADTIAAKLKNGETAVRTGVGNNGWSRLIIGDQKYYAISSYLTTDLTYQSTVKPTAANPEVAATFTAAADQVTAKIEANLRNVPSTESPDTVVGKIVNGDILTRTGIGSNGWSRLDYNGQTVYAVTSYLQTVVQ